MLEALVAAAALLLVVSGTGKLRRPGPAAVMLRTVTGRLPLQAAPSATRIAGAIEVLVGVTAVAVGGPWALGLLAATYAVLAAVAVRLLALARGSGRRVACGCFGTSDAPVGSAHLVLDVVCFAVAGAAAAVADAPFAGLADRSTPVVVTVGLQIVLLAWLGYLSVTALPSLAAARLLITPKKGSA